MARPDLGPTQCYIQWVLVFFSRVKQLVYEVNHSLRLRMSISESSLPALCIHGVDRENWHKLFNVCCLLWLFAWKSEELYASVYMGSFLVFLAVV